jgi:predicted transcriptional regulator
MKIKFVYWVVGFSELIIERSGELEVKKFNVKECMETFYKLYNDFPEEEFVWKEQKDYHGWDMDDKETSIVVEGVDGDVRWVFMKA